MLLAPVPSHHEQSIAYLLSCTACCHDVTDDPVSVEVCSTFMLNSFQHWRLTLDGASKGNPGPAGAGWVIWGRGVNGWMQVQSGGAFLESRTSMYAEA